jgi:hypothetical protein
MNDKGKRTKSRGWTPPSHGAAFYDSTLGRGHLNVRHVDRAYAQAPGR